MITTLLALAASSRRTAAMGWRRSFDASNAGCKCAGNLTDAFGLGEGQSKSGRGRSWKWIVDSFLGDNPLARTRAWLLWMADPT
nr:hypothetical protein Itr_chr10CG03270 [Ipomoea trifida]